MGNTVKTNVKKSKIKLLHQYYHYTGFYGFVWSSLKKSTVPIIIFLITLVLVDRFIIDFNKLFTSITQNYSAFKILAVFFTSESILGLVPPELFIAWAGQSTLPVFYLSLLALLSYFGGIVSFFIGKSIAKTPAVYNYMEVKMKKHLKNTKKWGGFLIVVGALLPIPFSMTSIAAGVIGYKFSNFLLFGLLRFVRFYLYALVIFQMF